MTEEMGKEAMFDFLYKLPEQFEACLQMDFSWAQRLGGEYRNILVTGLGGSAIGGDVLRSYCLTRAAIPVVVNRDYRVPAFAGPDTLVFAVSYSGNTEETLSAYGELKDKGARIIAVTTGGRLGEMARQHGYPVVEIPAGLVPRAATAYLFAPTALILKEMGLLSGVRTELEETVQVLRENISQGLTQRKLTPSQVRRVINHTGNRIQRTRRSRYHTRQLFFFGSHLLQQLFHRLRHPSYYRSTTLLCTGRYLNLSHQPAIGIR
jgi:bifunctional phosphoglucose/phosphomannose isomerase